MSRKRCKCNANKNNPCPYALERINAMQAELAVGGDPLSVTVGCDYYINSAEYGYSFDAMLQDLHGAPLSDKEICALLLISPKQLKEIYNSAIKKLIASKNSEELQDFRELVAELSIKAGGEVNYIPESFGADMASIKPDERQEKEHKPIKKGFGMPIHRSGKRVDIYGISSKKKMKNDKKD